MEHRLQELEQQAYQLAGRQFNISSSQDVGQVRFSYDYVHKQKLSKSYFYNANNIDLSILLLKTFILKMT